MPHQNQFYFEVKWDWSTCKGNGENWNVTYLSKGIVKLPIFRCSVKKNYSKKPRKIQMITNKPESLFNKKHLWSVTSEDSCYKPVTKTFFR